jgi:hypothetical protein
VKEVLKIEVKVEHPRLEVKEIQVNWVKELKLEVKGEQLKLEG